MSNLELSFCHVTNCHWDDILSLFGPRGACAGCWCMWFRKTPPQQKTWTAEDNKAGLKALIDSGHSPGLLAFHGDKAVGWIAVAPRAEYPRLERSRLLKPLDDQPVWSVVCFFVDRKYRRKGVTVGLLGAAAEYVKSQGGQIIEGYPTVNPQAADTFAFHGPAASFIKAGFTEVARPSEARAIYRRYL